MKKTMEVVPRASSPRSCRPSRRSRQSRQSGAAVSLLALALAVSAMDIEGQTVLPDCQVACGLELREVARLGESEGPGYVGTPLGLVQRSDGVFVFWDQEDQNRVRFFAPDGTYLRSFGRSGQGPGEFQTIGGLVLLPGDAVEVYDLGNRRFTVIGRDFSLGPISPAVDLMAPFFATAPDGSRVLNAISYHPDRVGFPLHWLTPALGFETSLGAEFSPGTVTEIENWRRPLAKPTNRSVWVTHQPRYRLEEWGRAGNLIRVLERHVGWLEPWEGIRYSEENGKPRPRVRGIHLDAQGRLWIMVRVPGERWQDGLTTGRQFDGRMGTVVADEHTLFDTVIEVIDPVRGVVVRSQRFGQAFGGFSADGQVYAMVEVDGGLDVRVAVWELLEVGARGLSR